MGLLDGKKGLIMGVANDHSIAWGIAQARHAEGADLGFNFLGEALERRVRPLAESLGAKLIELVVPKLHGIDRRSGLYFRCFFGGFLRICSGGRFRRFRVDPLHSAGRLPKTKCLTGQH